MEGQSQDGSQGHKKPAGLSSGTDQVKGQRHCRAPCLISRTDQKGSDEELASPCPTSPGSAHGQTERTPLSRGGVFLPEPALRPRWRREAGRWPREATLTEPTSSMAYVFREDPAAGRHTALTLRLTVSFICSGESPRTRHETVRLPRPCPCHPPADSHLLWDFLHLPPMNWAAEGREGSTARGLTRPVCRHESSFLGTAPHADMGTDGHRYSPAIPGPLETTSGHRDGTAAAPGGSGAGSVPGPTRRML